MNTSKSAGRSALRPPATSPSSKTIFFTTTYDDCELGGERQVTQRILPNGKCLHAMAGPQKRPLSVLPDQRAGVQRLLLREGHLLERNADEHRQVRHPAQFPGELRNA